MSPDKDEAGSLAGGWVAALAAAALAWRAASFAWPSSLIATADSLGA